MNKYYVAFPFEGEYHYCSFNSDQLANYSIGNEDHIISFKYRDENNPFHYSFKDKNGNIRKVEFAGDMCFHIADIDDNIIEKVPWLLIKIENDKREIIFDINTELY